MNAQLLRQTLHEELSFPIDSGNLRIRAGQLRARMRMYPMMVGAQAVLELLFVWLMWRITPSQGQWLLVWLAVMYGLHVVEVSAWWRYRNDTGSIEGCRGWKWRFNLFTLMISLGWGSTSLWLALPDLTQQVLQICVMLGLAAGAVTMTPVYPPSLYIYVLGIMLPLMFRILQQTDQTHLALAAMLLLYLVSVLKAGRELGQTFWLSLKQRYENQSLVEQLTEQKKLADRMRLQAEAASREKSRFLAVASHDLRQPLQALALFSEALKDSAQSENTRRLADQIDRSVHALVGMFDELLDVSRLDAGVVELRWQNFELQPLLDRLYVDFAPVAQGKGLYFNIVEAGSNFAMADAHPESRIVYSDPFLLERMLRNLISNAIRYTDAGRVELRSRCADGKLHFEVRDTGSGIRTEDIPHIFEEYYQADNPQRDRRKGLGLGLAIVRRVQDLLDCPVAVVSELGKGSVFSFDIELGDADNLSYPFMISHSLHDLSGTEVVLLEDDPDIRLIVSELMEQWGCRVRAGELPEHVMDVADGGHSPDLLVCDYRLPGGMTATRAILQLRKYWGADIPAVILTGDTAPEMLHEISASGALLLHKPIAPARLRSFMHRALHGEI